ncbi:hypothetical protein AC249_AIPGENE28452 [Exaiptasia diaphana]|nr:hypothetical protein AC249_AIPGENE28452 [Exaiptasia diaphana]
MAKDDLQKQLKKENDELKKEIANLREEFKKLEDKMASAPESRELENSVEFLSGEFDSMKSDKSSLQQDLLLLKEKLNVISTRVDLIDETMESLLKYSYQYNLKIMDVPRAQSGTFETADQSIEICLNIFREMGLNILQSDIDIAHRMPTRNKESRTTPIICKFTRRQAKEAVMQSRSEITKVDLTKIGLPTTSENTMRIYEHLTPKQQDLLRKAKSFQRENGYKYCWVFPIDTLWPYRGTEMSRVWHTTTHDLQLHSYTTAAKSSLEIWFPTQIPFAFRRLLSPLQFSKPPTCL